MRLPVLDFRSHRSPESALNLRPVARPLIVASLFALAACAKGGSKPALPNLAPSLPSASTSTTPVAVPAPVAPTPAPAPAAATTPPPDGAGYAGLGAKREAFVAQTAKESGIPAAEIERWLADAKYQQSIINAITRPAEGKPWRDYRPIFLTDKRIADGRAFLARNRDELLRIQQRTGVPPEYVTAIIGVETSYGGNTGSYRVLDALYTLGFFYPKREEFFRGELAHLFPLARDERLDLATLRGSYAGAMGWGQFIPSSYRNYAVDGDGDGRRDLVGSQSDAMASVANYFKAHGWRAGQPVVARAQADAGAAPFAPATLEAKYTLDDLAARGYRATGPVPALPATLVTLEGAQGTEHWFGFNNFYVITRYNRSPLYAMAVHQLAEAIAAP
jgi:membrane-bound lytic murein transglycosylase B